MGNPCASLKHYRSYVIGLLPQLESLDGVEILYTERLAARQDFPRIQPQIEEEELNCKSKCPLLHRTVRSFESFKQWMRPKLLG